MKKKLNYRLVIVLFSGIILTGCGNQTSEVSNEAEDTGTENVEAPTTDTTETETPDDAKENSVKIDIIVDGEAISDLSKDIVLQDSMTLMEIMDQDYSIEKTEAGFITTIEGFEQDTDNGLYWSYYLNDEMGMVGAGEYEPEAADHIEWRLEGFEE